MTATPNPIPNPRPCRHLHTDGRPCGSPALRGEPFCFHHHTSRKPMPKRVDPTDPRILLTPQFPAPDDFPAIQRAIGEVLRLLANDRLPESRAAILLKGLAAASQNLARHHRREEKLAALGLLAPAVTDFVNDPVHGTLALDPNAEPDEPGRPTSDEPGCPTSATASSSPRRASTDEAEPQAPLPDPIPVLTPDPSPTTSYDEAKTVEINNYFQTVDDRRRAQSAAWLAQRETELGLELEALYDDRLAEMRRDLQTRFQQDLEAQLQTQRAAQAARTAQAARPIPIPIPIPIQQNQDLSPIQKQEREQEPALAG